MGEGSHDASRPLGGRHSTGGWWAMEWEPCSYTFGHWHFKVYPHSSPPFIITSVNFLHSYADMLSLPGYTFPDHYRKLYGEDMPVFIRPARRDVSSYYAQYPKEAGILSSISLGRYVYQVDRTGDVGFLVRVLHGSESAGQLQAPMSYAIRCKHVVLASGVSTNVLSPPPYLQQIPNYVPSEADNSNSNAPVLVVGSGFTAADILLSASPNQEIIHIYKWDRTGSSPLKGCHPSAYPGYAMIYRKMKLGAINSAISPIVTKQPLYEGLPNAEVISVTPHPSVPDSFEVTFKLPECSAPVTRLVRYLAYFVGRRGDLSYLSPQIQAELGVSHTVGCISGDTLRARVAADVEVTQGIFVIGSLTGDSLVKFGFGSGTYTAGRILYHISQMSAIDNVPESEVHQGLDCGTDDEVMFLNSGGGVQRERSEDVDMLDSVGCIRSLVFVGVSGVKGWLHYFLMRFGIEHIHSHSLIRF